MKNILLITATVFFVMTLVACESTGTIDTEPRSDNAINEALDRLEVDRGEVVNSVSNFQIDGWQSINNRNFIITTGIDKHYLINLAFPCPDLSFALNIALDSRTSQLRRGDDVLVRSTNRQVERCRIDEITELMDREESE